MKPIIVQAKRYGYKHTIGIKAVQEVIGAVVYFKAARGFVVTNSTFTKQAIELASKSNIELWDRTKLIDTMSKVQGTKVINNLNASDDYKAIKSICPICGKALVERNGSSGKFYGCSGYPECKYTRQI